MYIEVDNRFSVVESTKGSSKISMTAVEDPTK